MGQKEIKCADDGCSMILEKGNKYCASHKCEKPSCNYPHYYNSNFCTSHKCAKSWCNNEAVFMGHCMQCMYRRH